VLTVPRSRAAAREKLQGMVDDKRVKLDEVNEDAETRIKKVIQESHEILEKRLILSRQRLKQARTR
jgi:hypothetical protein